MIPTAVNIPLTLCSVVIRRFIDSYTGRLPIAVAGSTIPSASTVALFSGALFCLYRQLKKGTLVKIGIGRRLSSMLKNSRHTIQRRVKNNSWFLRNLTACRRKCAEAMLKMARQSNDSLQNIHADMGQNVSESNSLPHFNRHVLENHCGDLNAVAEPPLENLYCNGSFDSRYCSTQELKVREPKRSRSKRKGHGVSPNRPMTRSFRKCVPEDCGDGRNRLSRKRKKAEKIVSEAEDDIQEMTMRSRSEERKPITRRQSSRLSDGSPVLEVLPSKLIGRRCSDRIRRQPKVQKITRKTRSGRVYAYRL